MNYFKFPSIFLLYLNTFILTIDDSPSAYTIPIAKYLIKNNISAIWYVTGDNERFESFKKEIDFLILHTNLFIIGNHSKCHSYNFYRDHYIDDIKEDIISVNDYFLKTYNYKLNLFRPPYGLITMYEYMALKELNMEIMMWSLDFDDHKEELSLSNIQYKMQLTISTNRTNYIVLIHDKKKCYDALPIIISNINLYGKIIKYKGF